MTSMKMKTPLGDCLASGCCNSGCDSFLIFTHGYANHQVIWSTLKGTPMADYYEILGVPAPHKMKFATPTVRSLVAFIQIEMTPKLQPSDPGHSRSSSDPWKSRIETTIRCCPLFHLDGRPQMLTIFVMFHLNCEKYSAQTQKRKKHRVYGNSAPNA